MKNMKKHSVDLEGLIAQVQQQLNDIDKKMDTLISQVSAKFSEAQHHKPFQRSDQPRPQGESRQTDNYARKVLHQAICADCQKECEVPFRPTGDRPVYCRECFARRKVGGSFKSKIDIRPKEEDRVRERPAHKYENGERRKPHTKKAPTKKQWKKRS